MPGVKPLKIRNAHPRGTSELEVGIVSVEGVEFEMVANWARTSNSG